MEKPSAESYAEARKLFLVPLIFSPAEPPADFKEILDRYWAAVHDQLAHLTARLGPARRVFYETVTAIGDNGLQSIQAINPASYEIVKAAIDGGAELTSVEDEELLREEFDWQRCLLVGLMSQKVSRLAYESYQEANKRRYEQMAQRIDETLQPGEAGILFIREDHRVQFPSSIQVFFVAPPALDEIHRWLRERPAPEPEAKE